jgi:hypothetical protein
MAYTPPAYTPSGSLTGTTTTSTPYTYGSLAPTTSAYNIWGSTGNPYLIAGPSYTPGAGAPIVPRPVAPVPRVVQPVDSGGDSAWTNGGSSTTPEQQYGNLQSWIGRDKNITRGVGSLFGAPLLDPAIDFAYGINPVTQKSLSWYDGSTDFDNNVYTDQNLNVNDYNAAIAAYDLDWQSGMTDLNQNEYVNQYLSERGKADATAQKTPGFFDGWFTQDPSKVDIVDKSFGYGTDNPNGTAPTNNGWGSKGFTGDLFNTSTGRGLATPKTFGNPNSALAQQARAGIASEATRVATNIAINEAKAAQAAIAAENPAQAARDAAYVGTSDDGYAATANRYGTIPGSEQTAMLAEQDMGMSDSSDNGYGDSSGGGGGWEGSDANSDMDSDSGWSGADSDFSDSDSGGSDDSGGGGSYIATAATQSLGTVGLTVFNNWRDYMHTWHPTFTISFGRYRVTAPKIVKAIDAKDNSKELYKEIWDKHLGPIYKLIVNKDDTNALVKYKVMVKELMNKYLKGDK